jgi:hypothetical protein
MPSFYRYNIDNELPELFTELLQLVFAKLFKVGGTVYLSK